MRSSEPSPPRIDLHRHRRPRDAQLMEVASKVTVCFTTKSGSQSDFNIFMKLNDGRGVYFTKSQMAKGAQVIFPIHITDGRLESIVSEKSSDRIKSNIALGSLTLGAATPSCWSPRRCW